MPVSDNFKGLPIAELVAAPLLAACDSQKRLAQSAFEFMTEIGFISEGEGDKKIAPRLLEFNLQRPIAGEAKPHEIKVQAPFLGLVPLPSLLVDDVQIDFQMEVTTSETSKEQRNSSVDTSVSSKFKFGCFASGSVNVNGKVSSSRENTRSTNQTAKYQIHVSARQQPQTEGLSKLMDILASCVEPLPNPDAGGDGNNK